MQCVGVGVCIYICQILSLNICHLFLKDIQQALTPNQRSNLETMLRKYMKAVGEKLSQEMVLSLG